MRAVRIHSFGGPEVVHVDEVADSVPGADEVLVAVAAAGVNPVDWKIREGYLNEVMPFELPVTLGNEIAGTVAALGANVRGFAVGDRVHGAVNMTGGFAEKAVIKSANLALLPDGIGMTDAAAIPIAAATASAALTAAAIAPGSRVLVHSASGSVGSMFIQLAKLRGAHVVALTAAENVSYIRSLGADEVFDRGAPWQSLIAPVDAVFDGFGLPAQDASWALIKRGGILVSLVQPPSETAAAAHQVRGVMIFGAPDGAGLSQIDELVAAGRVTIRIAATFPFERVREALAASQSGTSVGKLVLEFA